MANKYWIGGNGNWSSTAHWSLSSGGSGGAAVPSSSDDVFLDANSFSGAGQTLTLDVDGNTKSFSASAVIYDFTITLGGGRKINSYGTAITFNGSHMDLEMA